MNTGMTITIHFVHETPLKIKNVVREDTVDNGTVYSVSDSDGKKYIIPLRNVSYIEIEDPDSLIF